MEPLEHIESSDCPCGPDLVYDDGESQVWVHHDISGKELTELDNPRLN